MKIEPLKIKNISKTLSLINRLLFNQQQVLGEGTGTIENAISDTKI